MQLPTYLSRKITNNSSVLLLTHYRNSYHSHRTFCFQSYWVFIYFILFYNRYLYFNCLSNTYLSHLLIAEVLFAADTCWLPHVAVMMQASKISVSLPLISVFIATPKYIYSSGYCIIFWKHIQSIVATAYREAYWLLSVWNKLSDASPANRTMTHLKYVQIYIQ